MDLHLFCGRRPFFRILLFITGFALVGCSGLDSSSDSPGSPAPDSLETFACETHPEKEGAVQCRLGFPNNTGRFSKVVVKRQLVNVPNSCEDGELVAELTEFEDQVIEDLTGRVGVTFGYLACVLGKDGKVLSESTAVNIASLSLASSNSLTLKCESGNKHGGITCSTEIEDPGAIDYLVLYRLKGPKSPQEGCKGSGVQVARFEVPRGRKQYLDVVSEAFESLYSYRLCGFDLVDQVVSEAAFLAVLPGDKLPPEAPQFSCRTSDKTEGGVLCEISLPSNSKDYSQIQVRRLKGMTPPDADCRITGDKVFATNKIEDLKFEDATGDRAGGLYSYRVCVLDKNLNINSDKTVAGVQARDTTAPLQLKSFSCETGQQTDGDVDCTLKFPENTDDYARVEVRRLEGGASPALDCRSNGTLAETLVAPYKDATIVDTTGAVHATPFSYRVCIFDSSEQLTSVQTENGILSRDTRAPAQLTAFVCSPSASQFGGMTCKVDFPEAPAILDYASVQIRYQPRYVPSSNCQSGELIKTFRPLFIDLEFEELRPNQINVNQGFRACIYDAAGNLKAYDTTTTKPRDRYLDQFSCKTGTEEVGDILCTLDFPENTQGFKKLEIRRERGRYAPSSCSRGDVVKTLEEGFEDQDFIDATETENGEEFSYRICVTNQSGNLFESKETQVRIKAKKEEE